MENEDLYRNFVTLLKLFKNRPYHLAKYLIQNGAIKEEFLSKIINSDRLRNIKEGEFDEKIFMDINQMNDFFNSLTIEVKKLSMFKTDDEIKIDLNNKLSDLLKEEKYEEAAILRDYMFNNGIKKLK
jgi:alcohol dehydrogenase YqhD (iron-dependent ADH family)